MPSRDPVKHRAWRNKQMHKEREQQKRKRDERQDFLKTYKIEKGCMYCSESHPACLQFHHRNPEEKLFNIALNKRAPMDKLLAEIAKCDILCANCHFKEHDRQREG